MMMLKKTVCPYDCPASCGLLVETDGEKVYRITGDPEHPATHGVICAKMRGYTKSLYAKDRILVPMKRSGNKGSGDFVPISWDEALGIIARHFKHIIKTYGPQSILPAVYSGVMSDIQRFCGHAFFNYMGASELVMSLCSTAKGEGYAQVMGNYSTSFLDKLKWDLMYIENYSLFLDFKILLMTAIAIFAKDNHEDFSKWDML